MFFSKSWIEFISRKKERGNMKREPTLTDIEKELLQENGIDEQSGALLKDIVRTNLFQLTHHPVEERVKGIRLIPMI